MTHTRDEIATALEQIDRANAAVNAMERAALYKRLRTRQPGEPYPRVWSQRTGLVAVLTLDGYDAIVNGAFEHVGIVRV